MTIWRRLSFFTSEVCEVSTTELSGRAVDAKLDGPGVQIPVTAYIYIICIWFIQFIYLKDYTKDPISALYIIQYTGTVCKINT